MLLKVRVHPESRNDRIEKHADSYDIQVRAKRQKNAANESAIALLARLLSVNPKRLRILKGRRSSSKTIEVLPEPDLAHRG